ncbi:DUF6510 family protein [Luedemannella helvata]|uniref:DUF6510 family protein n=1 Tax=Luedemannella helvata TaxID=349315 RepID=A0ABN2KUA2_9ACTN
MDGTSFVDGNELAGAFRELFAVDVTSARGTCVACGQAGEVARAHVYDRGPGLVARCPGCDAVLMRLVRATDRAWLDLRGVTCLEFALP